ncbi:hypothetical protein EJ08DRAFT_491274 [Tothia fuscella]|uniref:Uncharacterized protein n=1 Tax=Tothia fuscella TaxID=1048955 RepID=A0A9P4NHD6_9PEZI|nr:hypothetical protein EJ08DRAFT_491274 [Tothia fuscella]
MRMNKTTTILVTLLTAFILLSLVTITIQVIIFIHSRREAKLLTERIITLESRPTPPTSGIANGNHGQNGNNNDHYSPRIPRPPHPWDDQIATCTDHCQPGPSTNTNGTKRHHSSGEQEDLVQNYDPNRSMEITSGQGNPMFIPLQPLDPKQPKVHDSNTNARKEGSPEMMGMKKGEVGTLVTRREDGRIVGKVCRIVDDGKLQLVEEGGWRGGSTRYVGVEELKKGFILDRCVME